MEDTGIVLEAFPPHAATVQCNDHHQPLGTAHRERHAGLHPHRAPAHKLGRQGESAATLAGSGCGKTRKAGSWHDYHGVRRALQGGGLAGIGASMTNTVSQAIANAKAKAGQGGTGGGTGGSTGGGVVIGGGSGSKGGGGKAGAAWAPIEMQSFNFAAIPLGRSKEDIQKDINYWKKMDSTSPDVAGSVEAQKNVEKYERELAARKEMENPFAEAYSHDFGKDMERLSKEVKKDDKSIKEIYEKQLAATGEMVGGIQQMVGGLNQLGIEIPEGFSNMLGGIQGIITILEAIQTIQTAGAILGIFHNGGLIGNAAGGMLIPGNSYSGDHLRMPVDGGAGWIGVNSGELILNRAQQNSIAGQLTAAERGGGGYQGTPYVEGEKIFLGINNYLRRSGRGEIVTSR